MRWVFEKRAKERRTRGGGRGRGRGATHACVPYPFHTQTMKLDDSEVIILDIRMPCVPATLLKSHEAPVNTLAWAPHSACHICSGADDKRALIWDIQNIPQVSESRERTTSRHTLLLTGGLFSARADRNRASRFWRTRRAGPSTSYNGRRRRQIGSPSPTTTCWRSSGSETK